MQQQMIERERQREEAFKEYVKEKQQVDAMVGRLISEDLSNAEIQKQKQEQSR